jgi:hypothetical protein
MGRETPWVLQARSWFSLLMRIPRIEALFCLFLRASVVIECQAPRNSAPSCCSYSAVSKFRHERGATGAAGRRCHEYCCNHFHSMAVSWDDACHYFSTCPVKCLVFVMRRARVSPSSRRHERDYSLGEKTRPSAQHQGSEADNWLSSCGFLFWKR